MLSTVEGVIETATAEEIAMIAFAALVRLGEVGAEAGDVLQRHVQFAQGCDERTATHYEAGWVMVCL